MLKLLIIGTLFFFQTHATVIEMPRIEALIYTVNSKPIKPTKNYDFELDFFTPFSQVFVRLYLKKGGFENFKERDELAMKIVKQIEIENKKFNVPKLTVKVDYHDKDND